MNLSSIPANKQHLDKIDKAIKSKTDYPTNLYANMLKQNFRINKEVVINLKCEREVFGEKEIVQNIK